MSHTPGPWHSIGHSILGARTHCVLTPSRDRVLMTRGEDGLLEPLAGTPNGRLILAAPDLLEALVLALPYVTDAEQCPEQFKPGVVKAHVEQITKAIAKAEGAGTS